jgi:hypothetical protein
MKEVAVSSEYENERAKDKGRNNGRRSTRIIQVR